MPFTDLIFMNSGLLRPNFMKSDKWYSHQYLGHVVVSTKDIDFFTA